MNKNIRSSDIFSGEVQYFRLEPKHWQRVVDRLVEAGLKGITSYVSWNVHLVGKPDEANPGGVFDFEGRTDPKLNLIGFLDIVEKAGLYLNFRCGPFCCNEQELGGQPSFIVNGDPSMMVWNHKDEPTQGYWIARKEGMQPSYLHPEYLEKVRHWFAAVDEIIRPRLRSAGGFVDMINLDNEVSYIVRDSFLDSDYNPVNVRPGGFWHQFLTEKYGRAASLPYADTFTSIEDVPVPRDVPEDVSKNPAWYLDWVEFKEWCMCRYIRELRSIHESNGVRDVTFMTNFNPHVPEGIPTRMPSFELAVKGARPGLVGYDFYRGCYLSWSGYSSMARVLKLMNASLDYTWSAEFMSGTWELTPKSRVSDDHMRFMARCALAQGCKSLAWFMFHDRRVWGDSPVSSHGHARPSLEVLKETRSLCAERIPHWDSLVPAMDCAVIYDVTAHRHTSIGDPSPCNDTELHIGKPVISGIQAGLASREYFGLFRVVEAGGTQAGAVDIIARPKELDRYTLAFLPGSGLISEAAVADIEVWVKAGGVLVVSGAWPTISERGTKVTLCGQSSLNKRPVSFGKGKVLAMDWLGTEDPEKESIQHIEWVKNLLQEYGGAPHVRIRPVVNPTWENWGKGGGVDNSGSLVGDALDQIVKTTESRIHASAILHQGDGLPVLFVLNHYPIAVEFELTFGLLRPKQIKCLDTGTSLDVHDGIVIVDVDRKAGCIYEVFI